MSATTTAREQMEAEFLWRLAAIDMHHWRATMQARDSIESRGSVKRANPTYRRNQPAHTDISISPFEEPYSVNLEARMVS